MLDEETLEATAVVANNRMNRERRLRGTNGYDRDLGFDVVCAGLLLERELAALQADKVVPVVPEVPAVEERVRKGVRRRKASK